MAGKATTTQMELLSLFRLAKQKLNRKHRPFGAT
jgi:hypothetical protein